MEKGKEKTEETNEEGQEPSSKRAKLDLPVSGEAAPQTPTKLPFESPKEEVLDDRLALLSHEQLELLVTRLARTEPTLEEKILRQIERLEHSMSMFSPRRTEVAPAGFLSPRGGPGGMPSMMMSPLMMMQGGFMSPRGSPFRGGGFDDDFEEVNLKAIRRKVRAAFQKIKDGRGKKRRRGEDDEPQKYHLQGDLIRKEVKKAKDFILLKNDNSNGLNIMEAITDEFVTFGSEAGTENVEGYDDALHELAQDWVDIFLAESMDDFIADDRMDWVNKLFVWDKSADEAEGTFSAARAAAKLGWKDTHLQQVLAGDHIGKYTEPEALSIVRCNILEREKKVEQALNLARAVDLHHYTARYLIKLGKMDEAIETARGIEDPSKIFTIAQVARSMDVKVAFVLAVYAISLPHEWNTQNNERALWLCDLAISQNMLNDLVAEAEKNIKHKTVQFEIAKILKEKTAFKAAQDLAAIVLKPWPKPDPKDEPKPTPTAIPSAQQLAQLTNEVDPGSIMPRGVARWLWELSYEMILLEVGTKENMSDVVDLILVNVDDVDQLLQLAQDMNTRQEFELIIRLGEKCFSLVADKLDKDIEEQTKILKEQFDALLKKITPPPVTRAIGYNQQFDRQTLNACNTITAAALNSKIPPDPLQALTTPLIKIIRPYSPLPKEKIRELVEGCLKHLKDPTHIIQYAKTLMTRKEFELVLLVGRCAQDRLHELNELRKQREEWLQKLAVLQQEQQELLLKRKTLPEDRQEELNALLFKKELLRLEPYYINYTESQLDNLQLTLSQLMINSCITSTLSENEADRMSQEQILSVVIEHGVSSPHLPNILHRIQLLKDLKTHIFQYFPAAHILLHVAPLVQDNIEEMRKVFLARTEITVPLKMLQDEQADILAQAAAKKKKDASLPPHKLEKLEDLMARFALQPPVKYYEPKDCNAFDALNEQVAQLMLSTAVETRQQLEEQRWLSESNIDEVLSVCLKYCNDPNHLKNFMNVLRNSTSGRIGDFIYEFNHGYDMAIQLAEKALDRIAELEAARLSRFDAHFELKELEREKAEAEQLRKTLPEEQEARIEQLNLEHTLERALNSKYHFSGCNVNEKLKLQIFQQSQTCALTNKRTFEQKIETDIESLTPEMIAEGREARQKQMDKVVELILRHAQDPQHLINIGSTFSSNNETLLVNKFASRVLELVPELEKERRERQIWQTELHDLESEEAELKAKRKSLEPEQEVRYKELRRKNIALKLIPSFRTQNWKTHDDWLYSAATMVVNSILNDRDRLEQHVSQSESEYDKDEVENQREGIVAQLDKAIVDMVEKHVTDPTQLYSIASNFYNRAEADRVLPLCHLAHNRIQQIMKLREEREIAQQWVNLLNNEKEELVVSKKELGPKQQKKLEEIEAQIDAFEELPQYAKSSFDSLDGTVNNLALLVLRNALDSQKRLEEKITLDGSQMETDDTDILRVQCQKRVDDAMEFCLTKVKSPQYLLQLTNELAQRGEYELLLRVASQCQLRIKEVNALNEDRLKDAREKERLRTLEAELIHNRKALDEAQKDRLRELQHQEMVRNQLFLSYEHIESTRNDSVSQQICLKMIEAILQLKEESANKDAMDDNLSMSQIEKKNESFKQRIEEVVNDSIKNVDAPRNLYAIAQNLHSKLEYGLAIRVGARCQERIQQLVEDNEQRADIQQKIADLEQQQVVSPSDSQKEEIERLNRKLQELPVVYEDTGRLNSLNLQVAYMMIEAAKVEERPDVLRDQAVLRFKIQPTIPLFEEVKIMTEPDEWPQVKKELLEYILKPEPPVDTRFGGWNQPQTIDPKAKIELLLNEGMWKETAKIFPEPPYGSLEMLERLFLEVERNDPDALDDLFPVVEKYAVHFYQSYVLNNPSLERLLDQVQKRSPDFVFGLFSRGAEKLLLTVLPKQYDDFVRYLQSFKKRLCDDMGREDDWASFISDLVKKHKGKRKLMQLIQNANLKE